MKALILFRCPRDLIADVYLPLRESQHTDAVKCATAALSDVICMLNSAYFVSITWSEPEKTVKTHLICRECHSIKQCKDEIVLLGPFDASFQDHSLSSKLTNAQINTVRALPSCIRHLREYRDEVHVKKWMAFAADESREVRKAFADDFFQIVSAIQVKCLC